MDPAINQKACVEGNGRTCILLKIRCIIYDVEFFGDAVYKPQGI